MSDRKAYAPEHGVIILKDEDYVEVHRLEFQRFIENIRTINQIGEQWTKSVRETKIWKQIAEDLVWAGKCAGRDECRHQENCDWVIATQSYRQAVIDSEG